jgi:hypothetical protein
MTVNKAVRGALIAAASVLIAGCGDDSSPTTTASDSKTPASRSEKPSRAGIALCKKEFGGVSPNQRRVKVILADGTRCKKDGIITNGLVTISRPTGGWKTLIP